VRGESYGADLAALDDQRFERVLAPLFEEAPRFLARLVQSRPHDSWEALFATATRIALDMPRDDQLQLLDAHPRIGAPPGSVSAMSFVEQGYERDAATVEAEAERVRVAADLERLNAAYEARFGFRYVIFVAGRPRAAIVPLMQAALGGDVAAERDRALRDVVLIARDRAVKSGLMTDHTAAG
jgi:2-oxo-4-hydroxy-4-carboxy--5-ureidoimidazoline (OHCU) decarboxylase